MEEKCVCPILPILPLSIWLRPKAAFGDDEA